MNLWIRQLRAHLILLEEEGIEAIPRRPSMVTKGSPPSMSLSKQGALEALRAEIGDCRRCRLWEGRTHLVFGVGNPESALVFVGEGPGEEEDRAGIPFVGKAGQLLTRMIQAMGYAREEVYIANVVKCRPPGNRTPLEDEVVTCRPFLLQQLMILRPQVICALGKVAAQALLSTREPITQLRGRPRPLVWNLDPVPEPLPEIPVVPTFHPAYLLRNPAARRLAWEDLKQVLRLLGKTPPRGRTKGGFTRR